MGAPSKEEQIFLRMLNFLASQCGNDLDQFTLEMYDRELSRFGYPQAVRALEEVVRTRRGNDRFPSIADIVEKMGIDVSPKSLAIDTVNRLLTFFQKNGTRWVKHESWDQYLQDGVGPLGWNLIHRLGGYKHLYNEWCETKEMGVFRAHLRESCIAILEIEKKEQQQLGPGFSKPLLAVRKEHE